VWVKLKCFCIKIVLPVGTQYLKKVRDCRFRTKQKWKEKDKESEECPLTSDNFLYKQLYDFYRKLPRGHWALL